MDTDHLADIKHSSDHRVDLSIVVPCHNETDNLSELNRRVADVSRRCVGESFELILINDGSQDDTWLKITELAQANSYVVGINLSRNYGHQLALTAGLSICRGAKILVLDADLQDPPELLPDMIALMEDGAEVVYGQRIQREGETWFKKGTAALFYWLLRKAVDIDIPANTGDFRLMNRRVLEIFMRMPEQHRFVRGMISWIGLRQIALQYERAPRLHGETSYTLAQMVRFALDAITGFSTKPLRIASYLGVLSGVFGIGLMVFILTSFVAAKPVAGWTSLMAVVSILGSATLVVLGVIGEYVGRMYVEAKGRPLFIISETVGGAEVGVVCPHCGQAMLASRQGQIA
ncbi:MAG: glycosyltransferase family 2 protein [Alphaproteobacteria bacterium]|nr:glycosyltransferase family 2 protein [Alphaproteobacteria bacterium]